MELRHLIYFKKVAELQHITKAADELLIAQPALSKVIRSLEEELNAPLFDRKGKNIMLNANGQILLKYTNQILGCLNMAKAEIIQQSSRCDSSIIISYNSASVVIPVLATVFHKHHPDINIQFADTNISPEFITFYFDSYFRQPDKKNCRKLFTEKCNLAFSKNHRFAGMEEIAATDLAHETFLVSKNCHSIKELSTFVCESAGFQPASIMECVSNETVFSFIQNSIGIAFIPTATWNYEAHPSILMRSIGPLPLERHLYVSWADMHELNQNEIVFLDFCSEFFKHFNKVSENKSIFHNEGYQQLLNMNF